MTSNSRARRARLAGCWLLTLTIGALVACGPRRQGGAEEEAEATAPQPQQAPIMQGSPAIPKMQIVSAEQVLAENFSEEMQNLVGPDYLREHPGAVAIVVVVARPIDRLPRATSPIIELDGEPLIATWVLPSDETRRTLVAFVENSLSVRVDAEVATYWTGNEQTRTDEPVELPPARSGPAAIRRGGRGGRGP